MRKIKLKTLSEEELINIKGGKSPGELPTAHCLEHD